jgi:hypothetical protein
MSQRGQRMAEGQCGELFSPAGEVCIGANHKRIGSQLNQGCEGVFYVVLGARLQDMDLQPE